MLKMYKNRLWILGCGFFMVPLLCSAEAEFTAEQQQERDTYIQQELQKIVGADDGELVIIQAETNVPLFIRFGMDNGKTLNGKAHTTTPFSAAEAINVTLETKTGGILWEDTLSWDPSYNTKDGCVIPFNFPMHKEQLKGKYLLKMEIIDNLQKTLSRGEAWTEELNFSDQKNSEVFNFEVQEEVTERAVFDFVNYTQNGEFRPVVHVFERAVGDTEVATVYADPFRVELGETKHVEMDIELPDKPELYVLQAEITDNTGNRVGSYALQQKVVEGDFAAIEGMDVRPVGLIEKGETVTFTLRGVATRRVKQLKLQANIDQKLNRQVVQSFQREKDITVDPTQTFEVQLMIPALEQKAEQFTLRVKLLSVDEAQTVLEDKYLETEYAASSINFLQGGQGLSRELILIIGMLAIGGVVILLITVISLKRGSRAFLLVLGGGLLLGGQVHAITLSANANWMSPGVNIGATWMINEADWYYNPRILDANDDIGAGEEGTANNNFSRVHFRGELTDPATGQGVLDENFGLESIDVLIWGVSAPLTEHGTPIPGPPETLNVSVGATYPDGTYDGVDYDGGNVITITDNKEYKFTIDIATNTGPFPGYVPGTFTDDPDEAREMSLIFHGKNDQRIVVHAAADLKLDSTGPEISLEPQNRDNCAGENCYVNAKDGSVKLQLKCDDEGIGCMAYWLEPDSGNYEENRTYIYVKNNFCSGHEGGCEDNPATYKLCDKIGNCTETAFDVNYYDPTPPQIFEENSENDLRLLLGGETIESGGTIATSVFIDGELVSPDNSGVFEDPEDQPDQLWHDPNYSVGTGPATTYIAPLQAYEGATCTSEKINNQNITFGDSSEDLSCSRYSFSAHPCGKRETVHGLETTSLTPLPPGPFPPEERNVVNYCEEQNVFISCRSPQGLKQSLKPGYGTSEHYCADVDPFFECSNWVFDDASPFGICFGVKLQD